MTVVLLVCRGWAIGLYPSHDDCYEEDLVIYIYSIKIYRESYRGENNGIGGYNEFCFAFRDGISVWDGNWL